MNLACIIVTAVGILVTIYSVVITFKYSGLKKKTTVNVGVGNVAANVPVNVGVGHDQTAGNIGGNNNTTINNYGTLNYNTETKGTT